MILRISIGAFPISQETHDAINAVQDDRLLFRSAFDVQEGGVGKALTHLSERKTPELLIIEMDVPKEQIFPHLEELANICDPDTKLILISSHNDIQLFQDLINSGVSDYILGPVTPEKIHDSISKVYKGMDSMSDGHVIAFMGVSGGVGSSVLAHNTALELANQYGKKSVVLDLDIPFGTSALNFNLQPRQTITNALSQSTRMDSDLLDQFFTPYDEMVSLLASPADLSTGVELAQRSLDNLLRAARPMGDFVILDLPHIWNPWVNDALAAADELVFVARPDLTNLRNAKSMVEYIGPKRGSDAPTRLVLNQVGAPKRGDLSEGDFKEAVALSPVVSIPYDPENFSKAQNTGEMLVTASPKSKSSVAIKELATIVKGANESVKEEKKPMFSMFKKSK